MCSDTVKAAPRSTNNVTNLDEVRQARAQATQLAKQAAKQTATQAIDAHDDINDVLTDTSDDRHGNRRFDAEKVARLKAEIASGEYKVDAASVASKFIEHDRNQ